MALFCMVFGIAIFVFFVFGGYLLASALVMEGFMNILSGNAQFKFSDLFQLPTADTAGTFIICFLVLGFIGLMLGLGLFMNGLIYKKLETVERVARRRQKLAQREE